MGAPNVGKSSLVQCLSSGLPEICDYPFTTRSIKMGHFYVNGRRHQVRCGFQHKGVYDELIQRLRVQGVALQQFRCVGNPKELMLESALMWPGLGFVFVAD